MKTAPARLMTIALGIWLFISAFVWTHSSQQFANAWIVGLLLVGVGALAIRMERARYACTALAVWLFFSNWLLPTEYDATAWNNIIVSLAVFVASLAKERTARPHIIATPS